MQNHYEVLGIKREDRNKGSDAMTALVKGAYKKLALKHHPDKGRHKSELDQAEDLKKFLEIQKAYETLSDVTKREAYDQLLKNQVTTTILPASFDAPSHPNSKQQFYHISSTFGFNDIVREFNQFAKDRIYSIPKVENATAAPTSKVPTLAEIPQSPTINGNELAKKEARSTEKKNDSLNSMLGDHGYSAKMGKYAGKDVLILTFPNKEAANEFIAKMLEKGFIMRPVTQEMRSHMGSAEKITDVPRIEDTPGRKMP